MGSAPGGQDRVGCVYGNSQSLQLVKVHLVTPAGGKGFRDSKNLYASLKGLIGGYETNIPASHDEELFRYPYHVPVHKGLKGPGPVDPGQVAFLK